MAWDNYIVTPEEYSTKKAIAWLLNLSSYSYYSKYYYIEGINPQFSILHSQVEGFAFTYIESLEQQVYQLPTATPWNYEPFLTESNVNYQPSDGQDILNNISWVSEYQIVSTQRYVVNFGYQGEYKSYAVPKSISVHAGDSISDTVQFSYINETYSPGTDFWITAEGGTLSPVGIQVSELPYWVPQDPTLDSPADPPADPPDPPSGLDYYSVYLMETSDSGILLDDPQVTETVGESQGWSLENEKFYIIF